MNKFIISLFALLALSCTQKEEAVSYHKGEITLAIDPAFQDIINNISYRYSKVYPDAKVWVETVKEREGLKGLLEKKYSTILMSRPLTQEEKNMYKRVNKILPKPAYFAADALLFVVPAQSDMDSISLEEIKKRLLNGELSLLMSGANSSNADYIAQRLKIKSSELKYVPLESDEQIINRLKDYPNHVGIIGLNTISRPYGEKAMALRAKIKTLSIYQDSAAIAPTLENIKAQKYPFTRLVYFLTDETGFGMAHGFIRYAGSQAGQLMIEKNGLQPYYLYPRRVQIVE